MEALVLPVLTSAAEKLCSELSTIVTLKKQNATVVRDIKEFRQSLKADLLLVETKRKTLQNDQAWAIESLSKDLEDARMYLENCRKQGWIQRYWDAKRMSSELVALRQKLSHNFQVKLFFTSLELIIDKGKRTKDFHSKLVELSTLSAIRSTNYIKGLLQPLTTGLKVQEARFQQLRAEIRALSAPLESENYSSLETEKFLQDILAGLAESVPSFNASEEDIQCYDPVTCELMVDPVKCGDGNTYDRFTVFKYNMESGNKPLVILCPDESVRIRLFDKFRHQQPDKIMRSRRNEYRTEALAIAGADEFGEAIVRLDNVLQWDPHDSECLHMRDKIRDIYRREALNLARTGDCKEAEDMLETVQKWSPLDKEILDKLEMIKRDHYATGDPNLQQQTPTQNETVNQTIRPALVAPVPLSAMEKQNTTVTELRGKEAYDFVLRGVTHGDNSQPNYPSKTVRGRSELKAPPEHLRNHQPKLSHQTFQNSSWNTPRGDQGSGGPGRVSGATESLWWDPEEESFLLTQYIACILCQCKPCCCSPIFGRNVKNDDHCLAFLYLPCCLPACFLVGLDVSFSALSPCWDSDCGNHLILESWLRQKYCQQFH